MTKRQKHVWIPFFKGTGYIMEVPEDGVTVESIREFLLEQLQDDNWMGNLMVTTAEGGMDHTKPDESIGYAPPDAWCETRSVENGG